MDLASKKRKTPGADENGSFETANDGSSSKLLPEDARRLLESLTKDQLLDILQDATCRHADVLDAVRNLADGDVSLRKLFIRGLGWDTTSDGIRSIFSSYGELQEAIVIVDKASGKSKGYGFITFKHADGALLALKEPSKLIDGRMTVTQIASAGVTGGPSATVTHPADIALRKIFVGNVPFDMPAERLLKHFLVYGEIEEGPLGYDKATGKSRGYALFVYKTVEGANASLEEPMKKIDGHPVTCKLAIDGKKVKGGPMGMPAAVQGQVPMVGGVGVEPSGAAGGFSGAAAAARGSVPGSFAGPGGISSYGGYTTNGGGGGLGGLQGQLGAGHHYSLSSNLPTSMSMGSSGLSSVGQASLGSGGLGGMGGGYYAGSSQFGGLGAGGFGTSGLGSASYGGLGFSGSHYQLQQGSSGMASGGFSEGGSYGHSGSLQGHHQQPAGSSPGSRIPPRAGAYQQGLPPYF